MDIVLDKKTLVFRIFNLITEFLLIVIGIYGLYINFNSTGDFMGGSSIMLLYFTIQSNITIIAITFCFFILRIIELVIKKSIIPNFLYLIKFVFCIAISVTFLVFFVLLSPLQKPEYLLSMTNLTVHGIVPIFAIVDFFIFDKEVKFNKVIPLIGTSMPLYYLFFVFICIAEGVRFGGNLKVPYFFLDYEKLTWFNITSDGIGVFYWILILLVFVIGLSYLYAFLNNLFHKKKFISFKR